MRDPFTEGHGYRARSGPIHFVLRRSGRVVLAESSTGGCFEVFRLKHYPARVIAGNPIEESMAPPSNTEWGSPRGVTIMDREEAEARFDQWVQEDCDAC